MQYPSNEKIEAIMSSSIQPLTPLTIRRQKYSYLHQSHREIGDEQSRQIRASDGHQLQNQDNISQQFFINNQLSSDEINENDHENGSLSCENSTKKREEKSKKNFLQVIFNIKLKMLARRFINSLNSKMFSNLSIFQFQLIDDKGYQIPYANSSQQRSTQQQLFSSIPNKRTSEINDGIKYAGNLDENEALSSFFLIKFLERIFQNLEIRKFLHSISQKVPLFHPSSIFKIFWDFLSMCLIACLMVQIPIYITFSKEISLSINKLEKPSSSLLKTIIQIQFLQVLIFLTPSYVFLDTIISINTSYYEKGNLIKRRTFIIQNYWQKYSAMEIFIFIFCIVKLQFFSNIEFISLNNDNIISQVHIINVYDKGTNQVWTRFLLIVFFMKIKNCASIFHKFQESFISRRSHQILDLTKLIYVIIIIGHIISCVWLLIAQLEINLGSENTWINKRDISEDKWYNKYIEAFYFTMVTMATVGYGDVLPITPVEKTACVVLMLASCGIFAYSMNTIGNILENFNQEEFIISKKMHVISTYMSKKNVSKKMQYSIREYLDYYWREASERDQEGEEKIINQLSDQLKENLLIEANKIVLKQSSIFRKNFSARIKQRIIPLIREYRCTPEEIICNEGDIDDCSIFFIEKGSVQFYIETTHGDSQIKHKPLITLSQGNSFGEISFFTGFPRSSSVRSKEFTTLLMIKRESFLDLLKDFPEDFEQFMAIKDSLSLYQDYQVLDIKCYSCNSSQHLIYKCPFIHLKSNKQKILFLYNKSQDQVRKFPFFRSQKKKFNTLQEGMEYHYDCVMDLAQNYSCHQNFVIYQGNSIQNLALNRPQQLKQVGFNSQNTINTQGILEESDTLFPQISLPRDKRFAQENEIPSSSLNIVEQNVSFEMGANALNGLSPKLISDVAPQLIAEGEEEIRGRQQSQTNQLNYSKKLNGLDEMGIQGNIPSPIPSSIGTPPHVQQFTSIPSLFIASSKRMVNQNKNITGKMLASITGKSCIPSGNRKTYEIENKINDILHILKSIINQEDQQQDDKGNKRIFSSNKIKASLKNEQGRSIPTSFAFIGETKEEIDNQSECMIPLFQVGQFRETMENFDSMKNFEIYFPLNNMNYQLKLINIHGDKKKKKLLQLQMLNQKAIKGSLDSPMQSSIRHGGNNKSSIQLLALKYQKESEEQENQFGPELKKSKFHTQTKVSISGLSMDQSIKASEYFSSKTLNLINLQNRNSNTLSPTKQRELIRKSSGEETPKLFKHTSSYDKDYIIEQDSKSNKSRGIELLKFPEISLTKSQKTNISNEIDPNSQQILTDKQTTHIFPSNNLSQSISYKDHRPKQIESEDSFQENDSYNVLEASEQSGQNINSFNCIIINNKKKRKFNDTSIKIIQDQDNLV